MGMGLNRVGGGSYLTYALSCCTGLKLRLTAVLILGSLVPIAVEYPPNGSEVFLHDLFFERGIY